MISATNLLGWGSSVILLATFSQPSSIACRSNASPAVGNDMAGIV
jgi:hypothetical protein